MARLLLRWQIGLASTWGWYGGIHNVGELLIGSSQARVCPVLIICLRAGPKEFLPVWCIFEIAFGTWESHVVIVGHGITRHDDIFQVTLIHIADCNVWNQLVPTLVHGEDGVTCSFGDSGTKWTDVDGV